MYRLVCAPPKTVATELSRALDHRFRIVREELSSLLRIIGKGLTSAFQRYAGASMAPSGRPLSASSPNFDHDSHQATSSIDTLPTPRTRCHPLRPCPNDTVLFPTTHWTYPYRLRVIRGDPVRCRPASDGGGRWRIFEANGRTSRCRLCRRPDRLVDGLLGSDDASWVHLDDTVRRLGRDGVWGELHRPGQPAPPTANKIATDPCPR